MYMAWLSSLNKSTSQAKAFFRGEEPPANTLGILTFEAARAMSRLVALYRSLSDEEFFKLRTGPMKSEGVAVLVNSNDEGFLLSLACSEKLDDLDSAAKTVSCLARKCSDLSLKQFHLLYGNLKRGTTVILAKEEYGSRNVQKIIGKLDKYVAAASNLHAALESLREIEACERKLPQWKRNLGPDKENLDDSFYERLASQRKQVQRWKQCSLWSKTFDKSVGLMAQLVYVIYPRICFLFGPFVPSLPYQSFKRFTSSADSQKQLDIRTYPEVSCCLLAEKHKYIQAGGSTSKSGPLANRQKQVNIRIHPETDYCLLADKKMYKQAGRASKSGPIPRSAVKFGSITRFYSSELSRESTSFNNIQATDDEISIESQNGNKGLLLSAPASTVGGAGLMTAYANLIILAESYLNTPQKHICPDGRWKMYQLLTKKLKTTLKKRMQSRWWHKNGHPSAEKWKEELENTMEWLAPMAHDSVKWQNERNLEKQKFNAKLTVLLLQTLHFADLEKTEAAIVDVLVGLSSIYSCGKHRCGAHADCISL